MDLRETVRTHSTRQWGEVRRTSSIYSAQTMLRETPARQSTPRADVTRVRTRQGDSTVPAVCS